MASLTSVTARRRELRRQRIEKNRLKKEKKKARSKNSVVKVINKLKSSL